MEIFLPVAAAQTCIEWGLPDRFALNMLSHFAMKSPLYTQNCVFEDKGKKGGMGKVNLKQMGSQPWSVMVQRTRYRRETLAD